MAAKKKSKKGSTSKATASKKVTTTRRAPKRRAAARRTATKKSAAKARKNRVIKPTAKKTISQRRPKRAAEVDLNVPESPSGLQSGDLQGVSNLERAGSESVGELLEEGNASEAGIVTGVEQAEDETERPVHTHEVPQDDVPEEYLDKD